MDKYAVVQQPDLIKESSTCKKADTSCPVCKEQLTKESSVAHCKNCGTEPFEPKINT